MPNPQPLLGGWGGLLTGGANPNSPIVTQTPGNPPSQVFPGTTATDTEVSFALAKSRGYNAMRVSLVDPGFGPGTSTFDSVGYQNTLAIAKFFNMWILNDYHAYTDQSTNESAWISFWVNHITTYGPQYANMVWEPENEPIDSSAATLATHYQNWINAVRATGDTHWIVVSINNYQSETDPNFLTYFPQVTDPLDSFFYNFHDYYYYYLASTGGYGPGYTWDIPSAQKFADLMAANVTKLQTAFNHPVTITEFGADSIGTPPPPPDVQPPAGAFGGVQGGSADYSAEGLAYCQRLMSNLDNRSPRVGYFLWNGADWNDTCQNPTTGVNNCPAGAQNVWGNMVTAKQFPPDGLQPQMAGLPTWVFGAVAAGIGIGGLAYAARKKR